jgi:hypothetical protein
MATVRLFECKSIPLYNSIRHLLGLDCTSYPSIYREVLSVYTQEGLLMIINPPTLTLPLEGGGLGGGEIATPYGSCDDDFKNLSGKI